MSLFALPLLAASASEAAPIVLNGTLNSNATGWTLSAPCADAVWDGAIGNPPGAIKLNSCGEGGGNPMAQQTIGGFTIGQSYTLQWDLRLHATGGGCGNCGNGGSFGFFLDSQPASPLLVTEYLSGTWTTLMKDFVATSTTHTIIFAAELDMRTAGITANTDISYYVDNVSLGETPAPVPEPGTWMLMGTGAAVLAWRRYGAKRSVRQ